MFSNKNLITIITILILIAGGILIYYYYFQEAEPAAESTLQPDSQLSPSDRIKKISQESVLGVTIDNQKVRYYSKDNGNVFESSFNGSGTVQISSAALPNLLEVLWSSSKDKVIAIFNQNGKAKKYSYDYTTGISSPLDDSIGWVTWSPGEDRIAYQYYNSTTEDNNISIANPDGSNWTNVFPTRMKNLIVEWPKSGRLSIRTKPSGLAESVVYTIDLATGDFKKTINETYGLTLLWSPLGDKLLSSGTDSSGKNLKLNLMNFESGTTKVIDLITLPEKCVWSQDNRTVFCAVPKSISSYAVLPDDYYKKLILFSDDFWRINLDTGEKTQIYKTENEEATAYDIKKLLLSPLEDYLIFINQKDNQLYNLKL